MNRNLVILAGGISSRMKKIAPDQASLDPLLKREAEEKSKSMIGVGASHRPFLDYLLFNAREAGFRDIVIVVGSRDHSIREYYGNADEGNTVHGLSISYVVQSVPSEREKPLGTADALLQALRKTPRWKGSKFTVCNSDNLYSQRAFGLMLECPGACGLIEYDRAALEFEPERIEQFAVIEKSADGYLLGIAEKPSPETIERSRDAVGRIGVSMNIFCFTYELIIPFLEHVPQHPVRHEKELPVAVHLMVRENPGSLRVFPLAEHVPDLTNQSDIPRVQEFLANAFPHFSL